MRRVSTTSLQVQLEARVLPVEWAEEYNECDEVYQIQSTHRAGYDEEQKVYVLIVEPIEQTKDSERSPFKEPEQSIDGSSCKGVAVLEFGDDAEHNNNGPSYRKGHREHLGPR